MTVISSRRIELEEAVVIYDLVLSAGRFRLLAFLRIIEPPKEYRIESHIFFYALKRLFLLLHHYCGT